MHASCDSPWHLSAKRRVLDTCLLLTSPFRSMLLTWRGGPPCWLCTYSLRIIASPRKPGTMPPYHPMVRGLCYDSTPFLLSARGVGTAVVMCDAARRLAQPRRRVPAEASRGGTPQV